MSKRLCRPIVHRDGHTELYANTLLWWFREAIFTPLLLALDTHKGVVRENELLPATIAALREGEISYNQTAGVFLGTFSPKVSRELREIGGRYREQSKAFSVPYSSLPYATRAEIAASIERGREAHKAVLGLLAAIPAVVSSSPKVVSVAADTSTLLRDLEAQFRSTVGGSAPQFSLGDETAIVAQTDAAIEAAVRRYVAEAVPALARVVELSFASGGNAHVLERTLEAEFGRVKSQVEALAEGQAAAVISKFRQQRYESIGAQTYVWETKQDERVRKGHSDLHGRTFDWTNPPIVDPATGRRCHPGEDYRCRCAPLPVILAPSNQ